MTDRMLSAEKVLDWFRDIDSWAFTDTGVSDHQRKFLNGVLEDFAEAIDSGQLDADRPEESADD